jgi:hypothetical protein
MLANPSLRGSGKRSPTLWISVSKASGLPDENPSIFILSRSRTSAAAPAPYVLVRHHRFRIRLSVARGDAHAQKVLILFSDGIDTISRSSFGNSVDASIRNGIPVDCIHLTLRSSSSQGADVLRGLGATGGRYFPLANDGSRTLNVILEGFKQAVK